MLLRGMRPSSSTRPSASRVSSRPDTVACPQSHGALSPLSGSDVEFTISTAGSWPSTNEMADTEPGLMTIRWKRSRGVPRAWATAALMGSAWEKQTTTPPAWAAHSASSAPTIRACISGKLSPFGKRKADGLCCTVCHSGRAARSAIAAPVHSPKSHSSSPSSCVTASPVRAAVGSAVSQARSSGEE